MSEKYQNPQKDRRIIASHAQHFEHMFTQAVFTAHDDLRARQRLFRGLAAALEPVVIMHQPDYRASFREAMYMRAWPDDRPLYSLDELHRVFAGQYRQLFGEVEAGYPAGTLTPYRLDHINETNGVVLDARLGDKQFSQIYFSADQFADPVGLLVDLDGGELPQFENLEDVLGRPATDQLTHQVATQLHAATDELFGTVL